MTEEIANGAGMKSPARKKPKRAEIIETGSGKTVTLQVTVEATPDTPTYYVNHAQLSFNEHEVAVVLARMPTKPSREELAEAEEFGELTVDPELQVIIPPTVLPRLIEAMQAIQELYETTYWKIGKPNVASS